jgi:anaerobic ribonucleoside-triphosphate reductase
MSDERLWVCPDCGREEKRHHASKTRPFCDDCDWRDAVDIEMRPVGPGKEKFAEYGGNL